MYDSIPHARLITRLGKVVLRPAEIPLTQQAAPDAVHDVTPLFGPEPMLRQHRHGRLERRQRRGIVAHGGVELPEEGIGSRGAASGERALVSVLRRSPRVLQLRAMASRHDASAQRFSHRA
jgi:hypothetical protein